MKKPILIPKNLMRIITDEDAVLINVIKIKILPPDHFDTTTRVKYIFYNEHNFLAEDVISLEVIKSIEYDGEIQFTEIPNLKYDELIIGEIYNLHSQEDETNIRGLVVARHHRLNMVTVMLIDEIKGFEPHHVKTLQLIIRNHSDYFNEAISDETMLEIIEPYYDKQIASLLNEYLVSYRKDTDDYLTNDFVGDIYMYRIENQD